jgi:hypothetical protein
MNPLILNKERWYREHGGKQSLNARRLTDIRRRCQGVQARLAAENQPIPQSEDLRVLVYEDVPELVRTLERFDSRTC